MSEETRFIKESREVRPIYSHVGGDMMSSTPKTAMESAKKQLEEISESLDASHLGVVPAVSPAVSPTPTEAFHETRITLADVEPHVKNYAQSTSYDDQHTIISTIASMAPFIDPVQENSIVQLLSEMKDGKGVKLFESKEEVIRFLSRARGLRGNIKNNNKGKNRRAIFLNTSNRILPPEEIVEKNGRLYVDKHPLAYQF